MNDAVSLHYEVLSGAYSGLAAKAAAGANLIGSGLDADMVFVEQGLDVHHFRITPSGKAIEVEAFAAGIRIEGRGGIAAGERVVVPLPVVIHAGTMSILWWMEEPVKAGSIGMSRLSISVLAILLVGALGIGTLSAIFFYNGSADVSNVNPSGSELAPKLAVNRPDDQVTQEAAKALQVEVNRAGLLNIKVDSAQGFVTAKGTIAPALVTRWQNVQQWFDHRTNGALTLVSAVTTKEEKVPSSIAVEAVWRGSLPYLLISGQKYFVGALLDDGWTVDRIEEGRVLLSRNGRLAALPY